MQLALIAIVLLGGLLCGGPAGTVRDACLAVTDIPSNTWQEVNLKFVLPEGIPDAKWGTSDNFCGSTFRTKTGTVLWRTGVSSKQMELSPGFYSNVTLEWNPASSAARAIDVFTGWGGGSYGGGKLLPNFKDRPTPSPRHVYDSFAYVDGEDAVYLMLGANLRIRGKAEPDALAELERDNQCTWRYSFADRAWQRIEHNVRLLPGGEKISLYESHMRHWPEGQRLIFLDSNGGFYAEFDLKQQNWQKVELVDCSPIRLYTARSAWDSNRQIWIFRLGPKVCNFAPRTRTFTPLPDAYEAPAAEDDLRNKCKGVAYISKHDVYLLPGPTGNNTYVYDPQQNKWRNIQGGSIALENGYPQYDPKTDLVLLLRQHSTYRFHFVPERDWRRR